MQPQALELPVSQWRPGQLELAARMASSEKKMILLQAPTGSGKSLLALALRRLLGERAVILVGTKVLQSQYLTDYAASGLVEAKGRPNFVCNRHPSVTADKAVCTHGVTCIKANTPDCDYYDQKITAQNADEAVLNYPYWLAQTNYANAFRHVPLLICDEAHTIEDEVRKFATKAITHSTVGMAGCTWPASPLDIFGWGVWAQRALPTVLGHLKRTDKESPQYKRLQGLTETLQWFRTDEWEDDNWLAVDTKFGVEFRPVWVDQITRDVFLRHAERFIFMSATILNPESFCAQLGISPGDVEFIDVPSTFPKSRRPLVYTPVGKVSAGNDAALRRLVERTREILARHPGRGLVHTANYKIARHLVENLHSPRVHTHDTAGRAGALAKLRATPNAVLVSPSMGTGVDLPYELCEFQIIAKLPFPDLGDPQVKKRLKKGPDGKPLPKGANWYNHATICALVQSYGRGMRAPDDNCVTYLLDGNWAWLGPATRGMQPLWFREAITYERPPAYDSPSVDEQLRRVVAATNSSP